MGCDGYDDDVVFLSVSHDGDVGNTGVSGRVDPVVNRVYNIYIRLLNQARTSVRVSEIQDAGPYVTNVRGTSATNVNNCVLLPSAPIQSVQHLTPARCQ